MNALSLGQIAVGLVLLVVGGEALVRGASRLASRLGLSALVIGLTVVAFATSAPELAVALDAVQGGAPELAIGNAVGSNIANVFLVLGASAVILPLAVKSELIRLDLPVMVGLSGLLLVLALDGTLGALDGLLLLAVLTGYVVLSVILGRRRGRTTATGAATRERAATREGPATREGAALPAASRGLALADVAFVARGVGLLVLGASLLVDGAVSIATSLGVSNLVVGLTVVAVGTSLPELATSLVAARQGERDLAVGNIVGSNVFNLGLVLGLPALLGGGLPVPDAAVAFDLPVMIAASLALLPVAFTGFTVARWEGALFLGLFAAYTAYVVLAAAAHDALAGFTGVMLAFVLPIVAVTLIVLAAFEARKRRRAGEPLL